MKIMHITIQTEKAEEEIAFFQKYAGLKIQGDLRPKGKDIVFLAENDGDTQIEVIKSDAALDSGNANFSIGFHAEDVDSLHARLIEDGFNPSPFASPMPQVKFFFVKDPVGINIQFM